MRFPSYIHDAAAIDDRHVLVLRSNPDNLKPGFLERWNVITGKREYAVSAGAPLTHTLAVRGARAATGDTEGTIRIWRVADGTCARVIDTGGKPRHRSVGALAFLDDSRLLAASFDGMAMWEVASGEKLATIKSRGYAVWDIAVTLDNSRYLAACSDRSVRVWDASTGKCVDKFLERGLPPHAAHGDAQDAHTATSVSVWPDGQQAAASYGDGTIRRWDLSSGKMIKKIRTSGTDTAWLLSVAVSPSGDRVIAGSWDTNVYVWDLRSDPQPMAGHIGEAGPVFFLDDRRAVSVSFDQTVRVWDIASRRCERVIGKPIESSRFPPNVSLW
jgi:WD40 repeat protein